MSMHSVSLVFEGEVFSLYVEVEGKEVHLRFDGDHTWERKLSQLPIEGTLDLFCIAKGLSQTECVMTLSVDDHPGWTGRDTVGASGVLVFKTSVPVT